MDSAEIPTMDLSKATDAASFNQISNTMEGLYLRNTVVCMNDTPQYGSDPLYILSIFHPNTHSTRRISCLL